MLAAGDIARSRLVNSSQSLALERLCLAYWQPLYAYVRRRVRDEHLAQDLTQSFFERLMTGRSLMLADPARGRFRTFLLKAFDWHVANEQREGRALKRGGQSRILSLEFSAAVVLNDCASLTAEQIFERQWALTLLNLVMEQLQAEQTALGKSEQFELLKSFLVGERSAGGYASVCDRLRMTEAAARMAVSRLRSRYRELLRQEILRTVASIQDVDDEIHQLFKAFS